MAFREFYRSIVQNMATRREIAFNDLRAREHEFNPDGSRKSAAQFLRDAKEVVERARADSKNDLTPQ